MTKIIGAPTLDDALTALAETVEESEAHGCRSIIFCEDRLTLLAERAVLRRSKGTFLTEVTTFARFLSGEGKTLSKQGSVMAVSAILAAREGELRCFKKSAAQTVYETIAQLKASRVDAESLKRSAEETDGMLRAKLLDLALVLSAYEQFLSERGIVDENGYLALLPAKIEREARGADICFFAFPSFTRQAAEGIRAACTVGAHVTGIFFAGKHPACTNEAPTLFRRIAEEVGQAERSMLPSTLSGEALRLSRGLFTPDAYARERAETDDIFVFHAADEAEEVAIACALIKKHVYEEGLRYRDFVILLPDKSRFPEAERILSDYRIPFFSDRRRPFSEHPFAVFVQSILACVHDGGLPDSVDAAASSVYFKGGDNYRNYLLKYGGFRGAVDREIKTGEPVKHYDREELVSCRERMRACLALFPREGKGKKFTAGVRGLFALTEAEKVTERLQEEVEGAAREFLSLAPLEGALAEIEEIAGEEKMTAREFALLLENGLSALEIAMIPQSADAVFVGDATESRFERAPVLFCLGLDDSLPRTGEDTAVISDSEIKRLKMLSVEIEPAIAVVNSRARESLYHNLCAFSKRLYLGCPLRVGGEEARDSEVISAIGKMYFVPPMPETYPYDCCERVPAIDALFRMREDVECRRSDGTAFHALYYALRREGVDVDALLRSPDKLPLPLLNSLLFGGEVSPSLLEDYFECPYAGFVTRGLRLREREERSVLDTDTGMFVHTVLEHVAKRFNEMQSVEECRTAAREEAEVLLKEPRYLSLGDTGAGSYTGKRLVTECEEVSVACFLQLALSTFRVLETEEKVTLPTLGMGGRADRVDASGEYVRIIDYKTGTIDDTPTAYYTGRKLQLQLYLLAVSEGKIPAGAFYFPAQTSIIKDGENRFRMKGFFVKDDEVTIRMDTQRTEGKSTLYEGGGGTDKGMSQEDFEAFLEYSVRISEQALYEMRRGNISPSPYDAACVWCSYRSLCGFTGEARRERAVRCSDIVALVKREREEEI